MVTVVRLSLFLGAVAIGSAARSAAANAGRGAPGWGWITRRRVNRPEPVQNFWARHTEPRLPATVSSAMP